MDLAVFNNRLNLRTVVAIKGIKTADPRTSLITEHPATHAQQQKLNDESSNDPAE